jgi:acetyl esterase/lipase
LKAATLEGRNEGSLMTQPVYRLLSLLLCLVSAGILSRAENEPFRKLTGISYAKVDGHDLLLDLYLPTDRSSPAPLVVFVHGGAWRAGSKARMPLTGLVRQGYAVASADYRLSPVARFPAQIHDLKAAIRFLRAKQDEYGYGTQRLAIAGNSAGGAFGGARRRHQRS